MGRTIGNSSKWFKDNGDYIHRLNYKLNERSIVFDLGGFEGWFTKEINNKFHSKIFCFEPISEYYLKMKNDFINCENIKVFPYAIYNQIGKMCIFSNENCSTFFNESNNIPNINTIEVDTITLDHFMKINNINNIDLIKINIEGSEYVLLEYMITNNLIKKCDNIQVQFHTIIDNYESRYNKIKIELEKTHYLTYNYPFVWENWEKIYN